MFVKLLTSAAAVASLWTPAMAGNVGSVTVGAPLLTNVALLEQYYAHPTFYINTQFLDVKGYYYIPNQLVYDTILPPNFPNVSPADCDVTLWDFLPVTSRFESNLTNNATFTYGYLALSSNNSMILGMPSVGPPNNSQIFTVTPIYESDDSGLLQYFWGYDSSTTNLYFVGDTATDPELYPLGSYTTQPVKPTSQGWVSISGESPSDGGGTFQLFSGPAPSNFSSTAVPPNQSQTSSATGSAGGSTSSFVTVSTTGTNPSPMTTLTASGTSASVSKSASSSPKSSAITTTGNTTYVPSSSGSMLAITIPAVSLQLGLLLLGLGLSCVY